MTVGIYLVLLVVLLLFVIDANAYKISINDPSVQNPLRRDDQRVADTSRSRSRNKRALSQSEIDIFLDAHNDYRRQRLASNMEKQHWSTSEAAEAEALANSCVFAHDRNGQNLYLGSSGDLAYAVQLWHDEIQFYTYESNTCQPEEVCGHYTQVVWYSSYEVGCAINQCANHNNQYLIACNYKVAGNLIGSKPYELGSPCTDCPTGADFCNNGLCDRTCTQEISGVCDCNQACTNGFVTDKCFCACPPAFTGADCSEACVDKKEQWECDIYVGQGYCSEDSVYYGFMNDECMNSCGFCVCQLDKCFNSGVLKTDTCTCDCPQGTSGNQCENSDDDDCAGVNCANGGQCVDLVNAYRCDCVDGYSGDNCGTNDDDCVGVNCANGGTCVDLVNAYRCDCVDGYSGANCGTNDDDCAGVNCANGGTCVDLVNAYRCDCVDGYSGDNCGTNNDDCDPNPCTNGGECTDGVDSFTCTCKDGFTGSTCSDSNGGQECLNFPCRNGGTPGLRGGQCACLCPNGYQGSLCQYSSTEANFGIIVSFRGGINNWNRLWRVISRVFNQEINKYCRRNPEDCCGQITGTVSFGTGYPYAEDGMLYVLIVVSFESCDSSPSRRKRDASGFLDQSTLLAMAEETSANLTQAIVDEGVPVEYVGAEPAVVETADNLEEFVYLEEDTGATSAALPPWAYGLIGVVPIVVSLVVAVSIVAVSRRYRKEKDEDSSIMSSSKRTSTLGSKGQGSKYYPDFFTRPENIKPRGYFI